MDEACALCSRGNHDEWLLGYQGFEPSEEGTREASLTLRQQTA